ncbi:MAG: hypothetical protein PHW04_01410 [Candidatus Wallbacteria bacterium]|nr:hypothetical protein [Candidatus Wallbacteria bacterium]
MKKILVLFLLFLIVYSGYCAPSYANSEIYKRNGQVYILVGDGLNKGVYGPFTESSETVIVDNGSDPKAKRLFMPGDSGKAIAVDMFNNVYLLCNKTTDFQTPRVTPAELARLTAEGYDPAILIGRNFYRCVMQPNGEWLYAGYGVNWWNLGGGSGTHFGHYYDNYQNRCLRWPQCGFSTYGDFWGGAVAPPLFIAAHTYGGPVFKDDFGNLLVPNGYGFDTNNHAILPNGYQTAMHVQHYYAVSFMCSQFARLDNYLERDLTFWDDYYNDSHRPITVAGTWDPYSGQFSAFEQVFHLFQCNYSYEALGASCGDSPPGENYDKQPIVSPTGHMDIAVSCTGRRYFYTTIPDEILKIGQMETVETDAQGIGYMKPTAMTAAFVQCNLPDRTISIGAATKDRSSDWFYYSESPQMAVCDQWDGLGGIKYELLPDLRSFNRSKMIGGYQIDPSGGLSGSPTEDNTMNFSIPATIPGTIETIAADGNGNIYYGIRTQEQKPAGWNPDTAWPPDQIKNLQDYTYVPLPGDPPPTPAQAALTKRWVSVLSDGWYYRVYRVKENNIADHYLMFKIFIGGNLYLRQDYGWMAGNQVVWDPQFSHGAVLDLSSGIDVRKLDLDIAVVNIAGPPIAGDDISHVDFALTDGSMNPIQPKDPTKPNDDYVPEDQWCDYYIENPPSFAGDRLNKNNNYGEQTLKNHQPVNFNGFTGGYPIGLIEGTNAGPGLIYYVRVIDVLQSNNVLYEFWMPNATSGNKVTGEKVDPTVTPVIDGQPQNVLTNAGQGVKIDIKVTNEPDNYLYLVSGQPQIERKGFKILFRDRGIYKIQVMGVYQRYNYETMKYPSFIDERVSLGYAMATSCFSTIDWRSAACFLPGGYTPSNPPDAWKKSNMNFIAEHVVHVGNENAPTPGYIHQVNIHAPQQVDEDTGVPIYATFYVQWGKYFQYHLGDASITSKVDSYDGVGIWNYDKPSPGGDGRKPNNYKPSVNTDINDKAACLTGSPGDLVAGGSADINSDGKSTLEDYPYNGIDVPVSNDNGTGIFGTSQLDPGAGNSHLDRKKDWGEIQYHWYVGAFIFDNSSGTPIYRWTQTMIKKGDLSDDTVVEYRNNTDGPLDETVPWDTWNPPNFADRQVFKVKLNLTPQQKLFEFVMPLSGAPDSKFACYYLWLDFDYPCVKWEPRDQVPDVVPPKYNYYDLTCDTKRHTSYHDIDTASPNSKDFGYQIEVVDTEGPALYYYVTDDYADGGTTADLFPREIQYVVLDNNPNVALKPNDFKLRVQIENPTANSGNRRFDQLQDRTVDSVYTDYQSQLDTSVQIPEGSLVDLSGDSKIDDDFALLIGSVDTPPDDSSYYHVSQPGKLGGLMRYMHRFLYLYNPKDTVGPLPENYASYLYWYVYGTDGKGNYLNSNGTPIIPPEAAGEAVDPIAPWKYAAKLLVHDNDPPELSFTVVIPKLNRVIKYQVADDDRDDIFLEPKYGFGDEGMGGTRIDDSTTPGLTALVDNTEWGGTGLNPLNNGTSERGKIRIIVTGDGKNEPRLVDGNDETVDKPLNIFDYFIDKNVYSLDAIDQPMPGNNYMKAEFFDFSQYIGDKTPDKPNVLGIDEDMRVAFEVKARDNVDCIENQPFISHNLIEGHNGAFPVTFAGNVKIEVKKTPGVTDPDGAWINLPTENIPIMTDNTGHKHAIFFTQFKESTRLDFEQLPLEPELLKISVTDKSNNTRAILVPFWILDTKLMDELLKRQKTRIEYNHE